MNRLLMTRKSIYGQAWGVWSLRKIVPNYGGPCLRLRRSSDNAEIDIGFSGNYCDQAAILSFCDSGNCFAWLYDQSPRRNNMIPTSASAWPQLVTAGVINPNGLYFNGTASFLQTTNPIAVGSCVSFHAEVAVEDFASHRTVLGSLSSGGMQIRLEQTWGSVTFNKSTVALIGSSSATLTANQNTKMAIIYDSNGNASFYFNGEFNRMVTSLRSINETTYLIGKNTTSWAEPFKGYVTSVVLFNKILKPSQINSL